MHQTGLSLGAPPAPTSTRLDVVNNRPAGGREPNSVPPTNRPWKGLRGPLTGLGPALHFEDLAPAGLTLGPPAGGSASTSDLEDGASPGSGGC